MPNAGLQSLSTAVLAKFCNAKKESIHGVPAFAKLFDHSMIRPNATQEEVLKFAETAARLKTATLTVQPHYIRLAAELLKGKGVLLGTVVGFPHGNESPEIKRIPGEKRFLIWGREEMNMVMNIPALKNGEKELFIKDVQGVVRAAEGSKVKVILENCYLSQEEKRRACQWIVEAGAHFVRHRQQAYAEGGATLDDVRAHV